MFLDVQISTIIQVENFATMYPILILLLVTTQSTQNITNYNVIWTTPTDEPGLSTDKHNT